MHHSITARAAVLAGVALAATMAATPAGALTTSSRPVVQGHDRSVTFHTKRAGEVFVDVTASAPGVSWVVQGHESAVLSLFVDGTYATDDVVPADTPITRSFALGHLAAGHHRLTLRLAADRSKGSQVRVGRVSFRTVAEGSAEYTDMKHAPVLYGRNGADWGGPFQNAYTDTPLVAWHEDVPATTPGHRLLTYSYIWSNEDGGTSTPQLMARWGRTTDIEWIYQVEVDAQGERVPGTAVYQSPNHVTEHFDGTYEGDHPLLQTCTLNNNICDDIDDPMRFSLSTEETLDASTQAREEVMDRNPWTYWLSTAESRREGKVQADPPTTSTTLHRRTARLPVPGGPQADRRRPERRELGGPVHRREAEGRPDGVSLRPRLRGPFDPARPSGGHHGAAPAGHQVLGHRADHRLPRAVHDHRQRRDDRGPGHQPGVLPGHGRRTAEVVPVGSGAGDPDPAEPEAVLYPAAS